MICVIVFNDKVVQILLIVRLKVTFILNPSTSYLIIYMPKKMKLKQFNDYRTDQFQFHIATVKYKI